jgi:hypothetical protein
MRLTMRFNKRVSIILVLCLTAIGLTARSAGAQFLQYTPPGGPAERPESRREQLARELSEARYRLGPVRIAPWATLRDIAYVRSLFVTGQPRQPNDLTATAGAGFRAYLRNGAKATWAAEVLPEYVWWQRQTERRELNGRYSLGFYGYFNRLTVEARAGREQQQQLVTPELPVPVSSRRDGGELLTEIEISAAFSAFAATSFAHQNNLVEDLPSPDLARLSLLDRDERTFRGGVRWRSNPRWSVGVGAERSQVDFAHGSLDRSNAGTAPVVEARFAGRRLSVQVDAADRSLTARRGAAFVPYHQVTGSAAVTVGSQSRISATLYANRNLVYSLSPLYAYLEDERLGFSLNAALGRRSSARLFVEEGRNRYTAFAAGTFPRRDDVSSYGAVLTTTLNRRLTLGLQGVRSKFDSNLPGDDRSYTSVGATITIAGFE